MIGDFVMRQMHMLSYFPFSMHALKFDTFSILTLYIYMHKNRIVFDTQHIICLMESTRQA